MCSSVSFLFVMVLQPVTVLPFQNTRSNEASGDIYENIEVKNVKLRRLTPSMLVTNSSPTSWILPKIIIPRALMAIAIAIASEPTPA